MKKYKNVPVFVYYGFSAASAVLMYLFNSERVKWFIWSFLKEYQSKYGDYYYAYMDGLSVFSLLPGLIATCIAGIMVPVSLLTVFSRFQDAKKNVSIRDRLKWARANYIRKYMAPYALSFFFLEEIILEKISPLITHWKYYSSIANPLRDLLSYKTIGYITKLLFILFIASFLLSITVDALMSSARWVRGIANTFAALLIIWETAMNWDTIAAAFKNYVWFGIYLHSVLVLMFIFIFLLGIIADQKFKDEEESEKRKEQAKIVQFIAPNN